MHPFSALRTASALILLPVAALAAEAPAPVLFERPLRELMGAEAFNEAGLAKLSPDELARLQSWLESHASGRLEIAKKEAAETERKKQAEAQGIRLFDTPTEERFESRIPGRFEGIVGRGQLITLENGQVWKVTDKQVRRMILKSPEVSLRAAVMGQSYYMTIRGLGIDIRVERVK